MLLSKSKLKMGLNCEKALFLSVKKAHLARYSDNSKKRFSLGNEIGEESKKLFPAGFEVKAWKNTDKIKITKDNLKSYSVMFEASFEYQGLFAQADILKKHEDDTFTFIEVKSGLSEKADYLEDLAIQYYILSQRLKLRDYKLWIVNKEFNGDRSTLFSEIDVSEKIKPYLEVLKERLPQFLALLKLTDEPVRTIGQHCLKPYECAFKDYCFSNIPKAGTIFQIPNFESLWEAYSQGVIKLDDPKLVSDFKLNPDFLKAVDKKESWVSSEIHNWKNNVTSWVSLHIESLPSVLPKFPNYQIYQSIPFGFSLKNAQGTFDFLHSENSDPRAGFLKALKEYLPEGDSSSILSMDISGAKSILFDLRRQFPEEGSYLLSIINRLIDYKGLISSFTYHPAIGSEIDLKRLSEVFLPDQGSYSPLVLKEQLEVLNTYQKISQSTNLIEKITLSSQIRQYLNLSCENLYTLANALGTKKA